MSPGNCSSDDNLELQNPSRASSTRDRNPSRPYSLVAAPNGVSAEEEGMGRTLAALTAAILACLMWTGAAGAQAPTAADFQKVTLDDNTQNPMQLDVAPDGRVFYIERDGRVQIWKPDTRQTVTAGKIPVTLSQENGLLGIALAPDFAFS